MSYEPREVEPAYVPHGEGFEPLSLRGISERDGHEILCIPTATYTGREKHCRAMDDTCMAFKARGTDYCIGHLRGMERDGNVPGAS